MKPVRGSRHRRAEHAGGRHASRGRTGGAAAIAVSVLLTWAAFMSTPIVAQAAITTPQTGAERAPALARGGNSLEAAAAKAGDTGRAVAMSLIGLAFAVAATVLAFRRDFKEAAGVFAVGIVSVLLATPAGVSLLRDTVSSLFGAP
jgi:hypothetical protein